MAIRFLHTADWHLGKRLHGVTLEEDHGRFFDWLIDEVQELGVSLVLIAGDVFDLANPASDARKLYYSTVLRLHRLGCRVIVTGGNHDSPQVLNAPQALLEAMNVSVVGGMPADPAEMLFPIESEDGTAELVVAAVPYLRDADLRQGAAMESAENRVEAVRLGIERVFRQTAEVSKEQYPNIPLVGMGHLFAHGVVISDSEREIQVGNLAGFEATQFPEAFHYLALGHIHRPQQVGGTPRIQYSGSPIALSFSERTDAKRVVVGEWKAGELHLESVPIPPFRRLQRIQGDLETVQKELATVEVAPHALPTLLEVELVEPTYDPQKVMDLEQLILDFDHPQASVVKYRVRFEQQVDSAGQLFEPGQRLADLQPKEVFQRRMEKEELSEDSQAKLMEAFDAVLEEVHEEMEVPS